MASIDENLNNARLDGFALGYAEAVICMQKYIYCISSASHPGIYKIDLTIRNPQEICDEANRFDHLRPYSIEFAKYITIDDDTEHGVRLCLARIGSRVGSAADFWRIERCAIWEIFMCIPGTWIAGEVNTIEEKKEAQIPAIKTEKPMYCKSSERDLRRTSDGKYSRSMWEFIPDGGKVRHTGSASTTWEGIYDLASDCIIHESVKYPYPSNFANAHHAKDAPGIKTNRSGGWAECEYEKSPGQWIKLGYHRVA
jgi:hypothetical protein